MSQDWNLENLGGGGGAELNFGVGGRGRRWDLFSQQFFHPVILLRSSAGPKIYNYY